MNNQIDTKQSIENVNRAMKGAKRLGVKPSVTLKRYHRALFLLRHWQSQVKTAQTKVKKYRQKVKYYQKRLGV